MAEVMNELKSKYLRDKEAFTETKRRLEGMIRMYENSIKKLEYDIKRFRPKTEYGEEICNYCDCVSMAPEETSSKIENAVEIYRCEICGRSSLDNYLTS